MTSERRELLSLAGAAFGYEGRAVLEEVDVRVRSGELIGVLGPNGAGKTTLFRGMAGLIPPLRGRVECAAERIGYVPQREALDPLYPLCAEEVVLMGGYGRLRGWRRLARGERERARAALAEVGLAGVARQDFASLSGGQRQRALIARALMVQPELCFLDEPTSGVDREAAREIQGIARALVEAGAAVLWVSHDVELVRGVASSILWVADGRVERAAPQELDLPGGLERRLAGRASSGGREGAT